MGNKKANILWLTAGIIIVVIFLSPFIFPDYKKFITDLIQRSPYFAPVIIIIFRFLGVVLAPLPGAPVSFASMAVLPWQEAFIWNLIGAESGSIAAFFIARKFREPVVAHFAPLAKIHQWQDKISERKQFWSFAGFRIATLVAFDFVSYAAGLTKLPFRTFLVATLLVDIPANLIFFYFGGLAVRYGIFIVAVFVVIFMVTVFILNHLRSEKD